MNAFRAACSLHTFRYASRKQPKHQIKIFGQNSTGYFIPVPYICESMAAATKLLNCPAPCEQGYPRQVVENSPSNIIAICQQNHADPIQLKFRDILIYSLRHEALHRALCTSLNIRYLADRRKKYVHIWHLGDYSGTEVYLTYETSTLTDTISLLYLSQQAPFILMAPTRKNITPEMQQFIDKNKFILLSIADELTLQTDGSFKSVRNIPQI